MPLWLTILVAACPLVIQVGCAVWFLSKTTSRLEVVARAESDTQVSLQEALREISTLARQIAVNDEQHRTIMVRLETNEREVVSLREWRHGLANRQMVYDAYEIQIETLRREVERIANRSHR